MSAKVKVVPPAPDSIETLRAAWSAVALVPKSEESCCARLVDRAGVPAQDEAKEWLTFMKGLDLVGEAERGFHRIREDPATVALDERFLRGVYGADALVGLLGEAGPLDVDAAFDRFEDRVPRWERSHDPDWRSVWRTRVARLLDWAVLFGLAERVEGGYVAAK